MDFIRKFREALKIPTVSDAGESNLTSFQDFLCGAFPAFHKDAQRWVLSPYSVVYRLAGEEGSADGAKCGASSGAVLLLAHYDVVPAEAEKWSVNPFSAQIKDDFVYGRGALDMKSTLICIMEAAENLCAQGKKPKRDIWFAFGGDEERSGLLGAQKTAQWFKERGQRFDWALDEGSPVAVNQFEGVNVPLALVSVEEKGNLSLNLTVKQEPGHASRPPKIQAAEILGRALCRIAKKPFPYTLSAAAEKFFASIAPFLPGVKGFVMRHARFFSVIFRRLFFKTAGANPQMEAMLKTTVAMTMLEGSAADNVMPSQVRAVINMRLLRPWTTEKAAEFIKKAVRDNRVQISEYEPGSNPVSAGLSHNELPHSGWAEIAEAVNGVWPGIPLLPFVMVAITDSRYYRELTNYIYRFSPLKLDSGELNRIHGHDERISLENLRNELEFYSRLLRLT